MSNVAVFAVGLLVTLLVAGAMTLLIWGAVIDGREDDERRAESPGRRLFSRGRRCSVGPTRTCWKVSPGVHSRR
jgi:hypothetical protein